MSYIAPPPPGFITIPGDWSLSQIEEVENAYTTAVSAVGTKASITPAPQVIRIVAPEGWSLEHVSRYEQAINARYAKHGTEYVVFPYGTQLPGNEEQSKAVVICEHCGQYAAWHTACVHCGAPVV